MTGTVVLQSHASPLPHDWLAGCMASVEAWSAAAGFDYVLRGDELFEPIPRPLLNKTATQAVVATDLARLMAAQALLADGYDRVVWCDADFLIFDPDNFRLPDEPYALGREVWVEPHATKPAKFTARKQVHNAFLMFRRGNSFLDFYADTAMAMLERCSGPLPPQFIGPKLLTALHNVIQCPVLETAGMLSPAVIREIASEPGAALTLFRQRSPRRPAAANLCSSLYARGEFSDATIYTCIERLLERREHAWQLRDDSVWPGQDPG